MAMGCIVMRRLLAPPSAAWRYSKFHARCTSLKSRSRYLGEGQRSSKSRLPKLSWAGAKDSAETEPSHGATSMALATPSPSVSWARTRAGDSDRALTRGRQRDQQRGITPFIFAYLREVSSIPEHCITHSCPMLGDLRRQTE